VSGNMQLNKVNIGKLFNIIHFVCFLFCFVGHWTCVMKAISKIGQELTQLESRRTDSLTYLTVIFNHLWNSMGESYSDSKG
jgi:hypothetical protein